MRTPVFGFIASLLLIIAVQFVSFYVFSALGFSGLLLEVIVDLVLAFLFAFMNYYYGPRKYAFKNPVFHRNVAIYFVVLVLFDLIFYFWR